MRILAFSDLHRDRDHRARILDVAAQADVLVGAGDFATRGVGAVALLQGFAGCDVPMVLVHGNHDDPAELAGFCAAGSGRHYLHGSGVEIDGVMFFGLGGEVPLTNPAPWNRGETEEAAGVMLQACPKGAVLVTHTPPFGLGDMQRDGRHEGSQAIRAAIEGKRPVLALCGHIHNDWGAKGRIGPTLVQNLGPGLNWFER